MVLGRFGAAAGVLVACSVLCSAARAQSAPPGLENVGVDEHLGQTIPLDLVFRDHSGQRVSLAQFFDDGRPVILNLVYHSCPTFCTMVLDGVSAALATQPWTVGQEMTVLTVSIDPRDSPSDAAGRRRRVLQRYGREAASTGWHFLVAEQTVTDDENLAQYGRYDSAERLAEALGFRYQWMPRQGQYAHPGVMMILTPDGRVARYLYGLEYPTNDVRLGLLEASEGRSISTVEHVLLYCYRYDATEQAYVVMAWRIMKVGGALTAAFLLLALALLWRRELGRKQERGRPPRLLAAPPSSPPLLDDEDGQAGLNARS